MSKPEKKALVPALRFPEFQNAENWIGKEVGEIFDVTRGYVLSMNLVNEQYSKETPYPVYSSQTKNNGLAGYYSEFLYENAITWTTDGANAGDVKYRSGKFYCTNVCGVLINNKGYANPCVAELLNSVTHKYVSYVGNPKLMNGVMSKIVIPLPALEEQQKIADCLSSIDDLITAQIQKLAALKAHKKGLMQQLFPAEGETVPELRFPEFRDGGEWEKVLLGKYFGNIRNGFVGTATPHYVSNGIPYLQGKNIKQGQIDTTGLVYVSNDFHQAQKKSQLHDRDILMVQSGHVGECAMVGQHFSGSNCHALIVMSPNMNVNSAFFIQYFYSTLGRNQIAEITTGNTIKHILASEVRSLEVYVPSPEEQQKIADCLSSVDELITAQAEKVEALKSHKKGLMQQLFPSMDEVDG